MQISGLRKPDETLPKLRNCASASRRLRRVESNPAAQKNAGERHEHSAGNGAKEAPTQCILPHSRPGNRSTTRRRWSLASRPSAEDDVPVRELEQSIDTLLRREGWSGAPTPAAGASKPKAEKVKPFYDGDGEACCPVHRKPLKEGQYGLYCSSKASTGEVANDKGYCNLRFIED
jgi:hypothetical protein